MAVRWQHVLGFTICLLAALCASAQDQSPSATLTVDEVLHFLSKEGTDILLQPGTYGLEAAEPPQLRLHPEAATPPIIVEAAELTHDKDIAAPAAGTIQTDEDSVHVVLFLPGGKALDTVGSRSGVRTRAGALTSTQLSQMQISPSTMRKMVRSTRAPGSPPPPILLAPVDGFSVTNPMTLAFTWRDGDGTPRAASFKLCIAEQGKACGQTGSVVYPLAGQPSITGTIVERPSGTEERFQGKRLVWTIAACAPNPNRPVLLGVIPESCTYAPLRPLYWPLPAPILKAPQEGAEFWLLDTGSPFNPTPIPTFGWEYTSVNGVTSVDHWLLCVANPGSSCFTQPGLSGSVVVERIPLNGSYSSVGMNSQTVAAGATSEFYRPTRQLGCRRPQEIQQTKHWTVAACNASVGCSYQENTRQIVFVDLARC